MQKRLPPRILNDEENHRCLKIYDRSTRHSLAWEKNVYASIKAQTHALTFIDLARAFDSFDRQFFIQKLRLKKFSEPITNILADMLSITQHNHEHNDHIYLTKVGISKGSAISPIFSILS